MKSENLKNTYILLATRNLALNYLMELLKY